MTGTISVMETGAAIALPVQMSDHGIRTRDQLDRFLWSQVELTLGGARVTKRAVEDALFQAFVDQ